MKNNILIIQSIYYPEISKKLLDSALEVIKKSKLNFKIISVPGALEIPVVLEKYKSKYSGFIVFGCVIRGETSHYDLVVNVTANSIYKIVNQKKLPLAFGLLTVESYEQAIERSEKNKKNLGAKAAMTCLKMIEILND